MLRGARDLGRGVEPAAAQNGAAYAVRGGSMVTDRIAFAEAMTKRFGDALGRVPDAYGSGAAGGMSGARAARGDE